MPPARCLLLMASFVLASVTSGRASETVFEQDVRPIVKSHCLRQIQEKKGQGKSPRTFRELLALHAGQARCAAYHQKMDPLGFALENYDAVGRWRVSTPEQPLDTSAELPTGEKFSGPTELKRIILRRRGEFERNLVEQLFTYALGRELIADDEAAIHDVLARLGAGEHRFSALVPAFLSTPPARFMVP